MSDTTEAVVEEDQKSCASGSSPGEEELSPRSGQEDEMPAETSSLSPSPASQLVAKDREISQLEEMVNEKSDTIKQLEEKLNRQKDYETIKHELSLLKSEVAQLKSTFSSDGDHKSLELFLFERAKMLQSENAALKAANQVSGHPHRLLSSFLPPHPPPPHPSFQNMESFSSLLGEEIANTYAKIFAKAQAESGAASLLPSSLDRRVVTGSPSRPASADDARSSESDESPLPSSNNNNNNNNVLSSPSKDEANGSVKLSPSLPKLQPLGSPTTTASLERLQLQLRQNVEKFMSENLNTMNISRCVRELLSVHNIGQRLFAKYVLGLSQGTVSELLSKPKPWDKLTEKGRDSYRKMHAWAADEKCIYHLKSLVPRKGKESSFKQDDPAAEERIQAILSEAQRAMITPRTNGTRPPLIMTNGSDSVMTTVIKEDNGSENGDDQRMSPTAAAYNNLRKIFKKEGPEQSVPPEIVARIYHEELAKLISQQQQQQQQQSAEEANRAQGKMAFERSQDEIRQALAIYHQEISRLSHLANMGPGFAGTANPDALARFAAVAAASGANGGIPFSLGLGMDAGTSSSSSSGLMAGRVENRTRDHGSHHRTSSSGLSEREEEAVRHSSAFSLVKAKEEEDSRPGKRFSPNQSLSIGSNNALTTGNSGHNQSESAAGAEDLSAAASPLQRMQSITNSLLSQTSLPSAPQTSQRPAKAVLPPITQQQFDQYNNLNTEDIVKQVKEQLSQYSISQRLFGESVLGLSQGSVSDLLARPKPWHMLTQKGREPFIRMKMFLEDDGAVHKLVASQYKIAPEKLMRTTGFIAGPTGPAPAVTVARSTISPGSASLPVSQVKRGDHNPRIAAMADSVCKAMEYRQNLSPNVDGSRSAGSTPDLSSHSVTSVFSGLQQQISGSRSRGVLSVTNSSRNTSGQSYPQPSVYEMAALTTDLDTQSITTKIKETLMAHNIGQKIFGEVVLGLSQGSVSELLSKPKPWHMLSIKGREPFIRMQLWLSDTHNIEKLQTLKNERREANKRRRTNVVDTDPVRPSSTRDSPLYSFNSSSGYSPLSGQSFPTSLSSGYGHSAAKKPRILFSEEQKEALKLAFSMDPYPTPATIEFLASELELSVRTITNWFHNHRMRLKQVPNAGSFEPEPGITSTFGMTREGATFDTVQFRVSLAQRMAEIRAGGLRRSPDKSKFSSLFGMSSLNPQMFGDPNSCSSPESSTQGDDADAGTLDLSMTSHNHNNISVRRTYDEDSDQSRDSLDDDNDSGPAELDLRQAAPPVKTGSSRRKPQIVTSSSSRRKPAQPQWLDPGLEFSGDEDDDEDMPDDVGSNTGSASLEQTSVNGTNAPNPSTKSDDWDDDSHSGDERDEK